MTWLESINAGEKVIINHNRIGVVSRTTKTRCIVRCGDVEYRLNKRTGRDIDCNSIWRPTLVSQWSREAEDKIKADKARAKAIRSIHCVKWDNVPTDVIEDILRVLDEKQKEANNATS